MPPGMRHPQPISDNGRAAKSLATANENKPKYNSCEHRNKGKKLLTTFGRPQVDRNLHQEIASFPLPTLK